MTNPLAQDMGCVVRPEDLKFSEYPGRISGGMSVGMPKGVMAVHLPTGIKVVCNHHRNQHFNRDACIRAIEAAIQERTHSAEIAGALRDAERYRWLREHFRFANDSMHEIWFDDTLEPDDSGVPTDLDQTIDSAMQQGGGGE